jgi:hypothetical protein
MGIALTLLFTFLSSSALLAWDPSGTWSIEGRSDATIIIKQVGDHYVIDFQSAYSKQKAIGYLSGQQLNVTYQVLSEPGNGFNTYNRLNSDDRISEVSFDTKGSTVWSGTLIRTSK